MAPATIPGTALRAATVWPPFGGLLKSNQRMDSSVAEMEITVFDAPVLAPTPEKPFQPFSEAWLAGPVPAHLKGGTITSLTALLTRLPEEEAAALVEFGSIWLDDRPCLDPSRPLAKHSSFRINPPAYGPVRFYEASSNRIVYEDDHLIIYNKESGRPSQGVPHDAHNNALSGLTRLLAARGERRGRLWLLHRLDADTSGLLMLAKDKEAAGIMGKAFQRGAVDKEYLCLGLGQRPEKKSFSVKNFIAKEGRRYVNRSKEPGLPAHTDFDFIMCSDTPALGGFHEALFRAKPRTGRTHQIRLHLAGKGWPIRGDRFYGRAEIEAAAPAPRLMLASARLAFAHPVTGEKIDVRLEK
ncbi:hypothetical protein C4J81_13100 [Deltaproteobacteria bacterium Smac51]|nr:hypothetical protein C4J81_13100 [Deltaproteobacteria bacterium Smac51]